MKILEKIPFWGSWVLLLGMVGSPSLFAENETEFAKAELREIVLVTESMDPYVEMLDEARLMVIRREAETALTSLEEKGLGNFGTLRHIQRLVITFRYSTSFFKQMAAEDIKPYVARLVALGRQIERERGLDDTPYTQIIANVFRDQHRLFLQLKDATSLPETLQARLAELVAPIGNVVALAGQGDRPKAFRAATKVYHAIETLYPRFSEIERSNAAFDVILEIEGLNEFFAEYAQVGAEGGAE